MGAMRYEHLVFLLACTPDTFISADAATDSPTVDAACDMSDFCSAPAQSGTPFCNDFDVGAFPWSGSPWNEMVDTAAQGNVTLSATQATSKSCPTSLDVFLPQVTVPPATDANPRNYLEANVTITSPIVHLDIDVLLPNLSGGAGVDGVTFFNLYANDPDWPVGIEHHTTGNWFLVVHQGSNEAGVIEMETAITPIVGAWTHMNLTVDFGVGTTTAGAVLTYETSDGGAGSATVMADTLALPVAVDSVHLDLGGSMYTQTGANYDVYYDNAVIR
jgi:hypothetical protein